MRDDFGLFVSSLSICVFRIKNLIKLKKNV